MDDTIKIIRSLVILSTDGLLFDEINKLYKEEVGEPVPFKQYGFATLREFLRSSGEFVPVKSAVGTKVMAKIAGKSAHIAQMTKSQNVSKADRIRKQKLALGLKPKPITMVRSQPKRSVPKPIVNGRRMRGSTPNNKLLLPVQRLNTANKIEIMQPAISNQSSSVGCSKHDGVILAEKENFSINSSDDQRLEDDPKKETETVAPKTNLKTSTTNGEDKPKKLNLLARLAPKKPFVKAQTESMDKASIPVVSLPPPEKSTTAQVSEKPKKPDLHSRFVQKQPFVIAETKESVKIILTQMAAPEKPHSAQITVKPQSNNQHHESPKALSTGERSRRSQDLHVRFAPNCIEQSEDGTKSKPLESYEKPPLVSYTPSRSSSHENLPKINLSDRLAKPKTENTDQLSESPRPTPPKKNIRAALLKICQESQQQSILPKNTEKEEKLNLNARLQQTQDCTKIESAPDTNAEIVPIKGNLSSRFSSKQLIDSSEVQTITKKMNDVGLVDVEMIDCTDAVLTTVNGVKPNLNSRLAQKQELMDLDENLSLRNRNRSITTFNDRIIVTIDLIPKGSI